MRRVGQYGTLYGDIDPRKALSYQDGSDPELLGLTDVPRLRLNSLAVFVGWIVPCAIFSGMMIIASFPIWKEHKVEAAFVEICCFFVWVALAAKAYITWWRHTSYMAWYLFLSVSCLAAWAVGLAMGSSNYATNMAPHYDLTSKGIAEDVVPGKYPTSRYLDSSRFVFQDGTRIAEELSLGYKDGDTYCVAPVVSNSTGALKAKTFDYFAVGINCCQPLPPAKFWCGKADLTDPSAHSALRWTGSQDMFALAIQQAEAEYGYAAHDAVLLTWTKDAVGEVEGLREKGLRFLLKWSLRFAGVQAVVILCFLCLWVPSSRWLLQHSGSEPLQDAGNGQIPQEVLQRAMAASRGWGTITK
mmetsp:Transcript_71293/g.149035  ORF Transcript_71293/g.149035 Transcript_71293/m.149035 type:complete len:357 (+) Transcript_71293:88-1158(+)